MCVGILAGIRPCGIIVLLSELFTSESKAQVYANLHQFLQQFPQVSSSIGKLQILREHTKISYGGIHTVAGFLAEGVRKLEPPPTKEIRMTIKNAA